MFVLNLLAVADLALVDAQRETTVRIDADPGLKKDGGTLLPIIRKRYQNSAVALLAFRKLHLHLLPFGAARADHPPQARKLIGTIRRNQGGVCTAHVPPPRIERGLQVPETCVISFSPRGLGWTAGSEPSNTPPPERQCELLEVIGFASATSTRWPGASSGITLLA